MPPTKRARARLARPDLLANEVTGSDLIGVFRTPSTARITRGKFGRMCTYLKAIIHLVSHSRPDIFQPPAERRRTTRWACDHRFVPPLFRIAVPGDLNSRISQIRSWQGTHVRAVHSLRSRRISGNRTCTSLAPKSGSIMYLSSFSCLAGCSNPRSPVGWL
jgi:hypothetical protein